MVMERLDAAGRHPGNQSPEQQKAIKLARQALVDFGVVDPGPKIEIPSAVNPASNATGETGTMPAFEIPAVNETLYSQTREALAKVGYTFVVAIKPVSIGQLLADAVTSQRFRYVNDSEWMRAITPQQMEIAISPNKLRIKNSNNKSTDDQIRMLKEEAEALKARLPSGVRDFISMHMQNASVLAQLDDQYQKATEKVLFTDWFGRTNDQTFPGDVAGVGRVDPSRRLNVNDWGRGNGFGRVFAVPVVVLPRKLAV